MGFCKAVKPPKVITLLCMLGTVFWASHDGSENARPPSCFGWMPAPGWDG